MRAKRKSGDILTIFHLSDANFTKNTSPAAIILSVGDNFFLVSFQFLGQKIITAGDLFLVKLATGQDLSDFEVILPLAA